MIRCKLFTHSDLDGVGCAILASLAFGRENVDIEYCNYDDVDEKVKYFYLHNDIPYDRIYITDISVGEEVAQGIDTWVARDHVRLFDHHPPALWLNRYDWCCVGIKDGDTGIKTCGTELFYTFLNGCNRFDHFGALDRKNIKRFVEIVRDYDTYRWKELGKEGIVSKHVNDLFHIYGRDEFIKWCIDKLLHSDFWFPAISKEDSMLLKQKQKDIDIYITEKNTQLQIATDRFGKTFGWVFAERYFSELGNRLCELHQEIEYVAMIDIGRGLVSFRSVKEDIDLGGEIAHSLGGGGHKKAAGSTFDAVEIGTQISWHLLNVKPNWSDILHQYIGEPFERKEN